MTRRIRQILPAPPGLLVRLEFWVDADEIWSGWSEPVVFVALVEHLGGTEDESQAIEPVTWDVGYEEYLTVSSSAEVNSGSSLVPVYVTPDLAWETLIAHLQRAVRVMDSRRAAARRRAAK